MRKVQLILLGIIVVLSVWAIFKQVNSRYRFCPWLLIDMSDFTVLEASNSGEFDFAASVMDNSFVNGIDMWLQFTADNPGTPRYAFIQIVRTQDICNPDRFYFPSEEKKAQSHNGWYVDVVDGATVPYFGQYKDLSAFNTSITHTGIGIDPGWMIDRPYRPETWDNLCIRWQAITAPTRMDPVDYHGQLGYYYWSWAVDGHGSVYDVDERIASFKRPEEMKRTIEKWALANNFSMLGGN